MIREVTIFGKKYIWNVERFIWNVCKAVFLVIFLYTFYYMLKLETADMMLELER